MTTWQLQVLRAEDLREIDEVFGTIDIKGAPLSTALDAAIGPLK